MERYIDANAFKKVLTTASDGTRIPDVDCDNFPITFPLRDLKRLIREFPTADVVKVVRCKDCKECEICPDTLLWCNQFERLVPPMGFCHCGTSKERGREK